MVYLLCLLLTAGVVAACVGWGRLIAKALTSVSGARDLRFDVGVTAGLGLAVTLTLFGFATALDVYGRSLLIAWLAVGLAVLGHATVRHLRASPLNVMHGMAVAGGLTALALSQTAFALRQARWNVCDDDIIYLYLPRRLLLTGTLIEPFSQRRIATYGGQAAFHGIFLDLLGNRSLGLFDLGVAPVVIGLLIIGPIRTGTRALGAIALLGTLLLSMNAQINLSPLYSAVALLFTGLRLCALLQRGDDQNHRVGLILALGIVGAGLLALRLNFLWPMMVVTGGVLVMRWRNPRQVAREFTVLGSVIVACTAGWAWALWRSSRTPLFPLITGTLQESWPGYRDADGSSVSSILRSSETVLRTGQGVKAVILILLLALVPLIARSRAGPLFLAVLGVLAYISTVLLINAYITVAALIDVWRFTWPVLTTIALFTVGMALAPPEETERVPRRLSRPAVRSVVLGGAAWAGAALLVLALSGQSLATARQNLRSRLTALRGAVADPDLLNDRYEAVAADYQLLEQRLTHRARVVAAVDYPALFGSRAKQLQNMDIIGSNSPSPGMPFFSGGRAKLDYLANLGYTHLVVVDPSASACLYRTDSWLKNAAGSEGKVYMQWAPHFLDWLSDVTAWSQPGASGVERFGNLLLIDIARARPDASAGNPRS